MRVVFSFRTQKKIALDLSEIHDSSFVIFNNNPGVDGYPINFHRAEKLLYCFSS